MMERTDALNRLALDPVHYALLRQLSEGWDNRQIARAIHVVRPERINAGFPLELLEQEAARGLDETLMKGRLMPTSIVVFRDVRWFRDSHPYGAVAEACEPSEAATFASRDAVTRWASQAKRGEVAVCHARALVIPPLPPDAFDARAPDGSFDRRPGVRTPSNRNVPVLNPHRGDGKARGVTREWAASHPDGPPDFGG